MRAFGRGAGPLAATWGPRSAPGPPPIPTPGRAKRRDRTTSGRRSGEGETHHHHQHPASKTPIPRRRPQGRPQAWSSQPFLRTRLAGGWNFGKDRSVCRAEWLFARLRGAGSWGRPRLTLRIPRGTRRRLQSGGFHSRGAGAARGPRRGFPGGRGASRAPATPKPHPRAAAHRARTATPENHPPHTNPTYPNPSRSMSVTFSVSGVLLRTFLNTIQCASKLGDGVFFVAHKTYLEISALNTTSSSHLLAVLPADSLGGYRFTAPASDTSDNDKQVFFYLLTRSLQVTVLHQAVGNLVSITVSFAETPQEGDQLTDSVKWDCACIGGVRKTFHLRTATAVPTRVCTDGVEYPFKVCGRPETFGYLLGSLPTSAGECIIFPLSSQFELRCGHVSAERNDQLDQPPNGVSTAVVTANASSFDSFECAIDEGAVQSGVLPGKMLELKPVKVACMLCKLLSLPMELSSGYEHSPVVIRSVAYQSSDAERLRGVGAPDAHAPISFVMHIAGLDVAHSDGTGDAARRDTAVAAPGPSTLSARSSERRASVQLAVESTAASAVVGATPSDDTVVAGTPSFSPNGTTRSPNNSVAEGGSKALGPHNDAIPSHLQSSRVSGLTAQTPLRGMSAHVQSQATHVDASYISGTPNDSDAANEERSAPRQSHISFARKAVVPSGVDSRSESHRSTGVSMVADSQVNSGRQSMTALYPLDFEAFTKASVEDEKEEIDEELQRFLDSCTAMLVGEAEQHDNDAR